MPRTRRRARTGGRSTDLTTVGRARRALGANRACVSMRTVAGGGSGALLPTASFSLRETPRGLMKIDRIHHVAYRCRDARQTVLWYQKYLNMDFVLAIAENEVPSTKEPDPYMHVFLDAGQGNILAFFELPTRAEMDRDHNTPAWVQHIAFKIPSFEAMNEVRARLEADGIDVVGPTDHTLFRSIYFFDPNGHRIELAVDTSTPDMLRKLDDVKWAMLDEWAQTRRAPEHARWIHDPSQKMP